MRLEKSLIIAQKDMEEFKKNKYILWTLIGMPMLMALIVPSSIVVPALMGAVSDPEFLATLPILVNMMLPMICMIPGITPSVIASYSLVGEKVNKSLEPILATPITDLELLLGKGLAAFLPTMAGTYAAFMIDVLLVDYFTYKLLNVILLPTLSWVIGALLLAPAVCVLGIEANVLISSRMRDVRAAQQLGGLIVIPLLILFVGSLSNIFPLNPLNILAFSALIIISDALLGKVVLKVFQREEILTRWK